MRRIALSLLAAAVLVAALLAAIAAPASGLPPLDKDMPIETLNPGITLPSPDLVSPEQQGPQQPKPADPKQDPQQDPKQDPKPATDGTLSVDAVDLGTGTAVPGVGFTYTGSASGSGTTPSSGVTVPAGSITVTATTMPTGYSLAGSGSETVSVTAGQTAAVKFELVNSDKPPSRTYATIRITKHDRITGAALPGATFAVTDCSDTPVGTVTTGADGTATYAGSAGCHRVVETAAPNGYSLDPTRNQVTAVDQGSVDLHVYDMPIKVVIVDRDPGNRVPIKSIPSGRIF